MCPQYTHIGVLQQPAARRAWSIWSADVGTDPAAIEPGQFSVQLRGQRRQRGNRRILPRLRDGAGSGNNHRHRLMIENPTHGHLRHGHAGGHQRLEAIGQFGAFGQSQPGERLTDIERGAVAVVVAVIAFGNSVAAVNFPESNPLASGKRTMMPTPRSLARGSNSSAGF